MVATEDDAVVGYAATVRIDEADLLADLFVLPNRQGEGIGRSLLEQVWSGAPQRMTFSSAHPGALPLYRSFGLLPLWAVHYLSGDPSSLPASPFTVTEVSHATASEIEHQLDGGDRSVDYAYWAARPHARVFVVTAGEHTVAVGATGGEGPSGGLSHLRVAEPQLAGGALIAALGTWCGPAVVAVPEPISVVQTLVDCGWRLVDTDWFAASSAELVDPRRLFPHSGLL